MTTQLPLTRPTQLDRVLAQLRDGPTCGTEFLDMHIPRYGGRILELRQEGYTITNENCWKHEHYSRQTIYRLAQGMNGALRRLVGLTSDPTVSRLDLSRVREPH